MPIINSAEELYASLKANAEKKGWLFNKDEAFVKELVDGLFKNLKRYGYSSCPCRMSAGNYEQDKDIICPCVYMEADVKKYGSCYCSLYVSQDVYDGKRMAASIPESRPANKVFPAGNKGVEQMEKLVVWRCCVCGYEYRGPDAPYKCPKCGVDKSMFTKEYKECPVVHTDENVEWECGECGYEHESPAPPDKCPKCGCAKEKFEKVIVLK